MSKVTIPTFTLNNGVKMPALGYGTWLGLNDKNEFDYTGWDKMIDTLSYCIDIGYRHIDTAHLYRVEPGIGQVVKRKIEENVVTREELFITTKVWQHMHREADVEVSTRDSLRRFGLDYLDLLLMHWPMSFDQDGVDEKIDYLETWRGFESVLRQGLVRSIGVSNFNVQQMKRLLANCTVKPVVNQIELNLTFWQQELVTLCAAHDVRVVAWAPLGGVVPTQTNRPHVYGDPGLVAIGKKYGKTVVQVALRYLYQNGIVAIPKTITPSRVLENALIFDFELTSSELETIAKLNVNYRSDKAMFWKEYANYPFEKYGAPAPAIPAAILRWKNGQNNDIE